MSEREDERFSRHGGRDEKREDERFEWRAEHHRAAVDPHAHEEWRDGDGWRTGMLPEHEKYRIRKER